MNQMPSVTGVVFKVTVAGSPICARAAPARPALPRTHSHVITARFVFMAGEHGRLSDLAQPGLRR
jgi:hypothetical protein